MYKIGDRVEVLCENVPNTQLEIPSGTGGTIVHIDENPQPDEAGDGRIYFATVRLDLMVDPDDPAEDCWWFAAEDIQPVGGHRMPEPEWSLEEIHASQNA